MRLGASEGLWVEVGRGSSQVELLRVVHDMVVALDYPRVASSG